MTGKSDSEGRDGGAAWPIGGGEMARRIRAHDWAATRLGPVEIWPQSLKTAVDLILPNDFPMIVLWGRDLVQIYNDSYRLIMTEKHPAGLGEPSRECWPEVWNINAPIYERVWEGESLAFSDALYPIERHGRVEDAWFDLCYSPLRSETGEIAGILVTVVEITHKHKAAIARDRASESLRESEALRRIALEGGRMGAWRWDLDAGLIWGDAQFWTLWGYPPSNEPRPLPDFNSRMSPESTAEVAAVVASAIEAGEQFEGPLEIVTGPTAGRWLRWQGRAGDNNPHLLYGVTFDITKQRQAEQALREGEERQAFLLKVSDALRPLADPIAAREAAARLLAERLGATRAYYVDYDSGKAIATVARDYVSNDSPSVAGQYTHAEYRTVLDRISSGRTLIVPDVSADTKLPREERESLAALGIVAWVNVPLIKEGQLVAILCAVQSAPRQWTSSEIGLIEDVAERTWAAVERARAEAKLRESEELLRQFGEASSDVLWIRDAETLQWRYLTPAFEAIYGESRDAALQGDNLTQWRELIAPEDRDGALASIERVRQGESVVFEYRIRRPSDGQLRWIRDADFPLLDPAGRVRAVAGIGHDATLEKETAERLKVLVAELQHRTRNLLAVVQGVATQTAKEAESLQAFQAAFDGRLASLSRVQGLLSRSGSEPITLDAIVRMEVGALGGRANGRIRIAGPEVALPNRIAQTFTLAIHELATNALKYGALSTSAGLLSVAWRLHGGGEDRVRMEWLETGIDASKRKSSPGAGGFGRTLIEKALPYTLGAKTAYELSDSMVRCVIDLPVKGAAT